MCGEIFLNLDLRGCVRRLKCRLNSWHVHLRAGTTLELRSQAAAGCIKTEDKTPPPLRICDTFSAPKEAPCCMITHHSEHARYQLVPASERMFVHPRRKSGFLNHVKRKSYMCGMRSS